MDWLLQIYLVVDIALALLWFKKKKIEHTFNHQMQENLDQIQQVFSIFTKRIETKETKIKHFPTKMLYKLDTDYTI